MECCQPQQQENVKINFETMKNEKKTADEVTGEVIRQFNEAFRLHDISILNDLIAEDCVMEAAMPAPNGIRTTGKKNSMAFGIS